MGRSLVCKLLSNDYELVLPVRGPSKVPTKFLENPRVKIVSTLDGQLDEALQDVSGVVHLAGLAHVRNTQVKNAFRIANVDLTTRLVNGVKRAGGISLFVNMSSLAALTDNMSDQIIDDATIPSPATEYGHSKLQAENCVASLAELGVTAISLRPPVIIGSDAGGNWASLQRLAASGLPLPFGYVQNRRSLVSIQTVTEAIHHLFCACPSAERSGSYCLADAETLSLRSIITELRAGMGMGARLVRVPVPVLNVLNYLPGLGRLTGGLFGDLVVDSSRFNSTFCFQGELSLREAIRLSGSNYRAQIDL